MDSRLLLDRAPDPRRYGRRSAPGGSPRLQLAEVSRQPVSGRRRSDRGDAEGGTTRFQNPLRLHCRRQSGSCLEHVYLENLWKDDVIKERFSVVGGSIAVPKGPGLGVTFDREKLEKYKRGPARAPIRLLARVKYENGLTIFYRHNPEKPGSLLNLRSLARVGVPGPVPGYRNHVLDGVLGSGRHGRVQESLGEDGIRSLLGHAVSRSSRSLTTNGREQTRSPAVLPVLPISRGGSSHVESCRGRGALPVPLHDRLLHNKLP